MAKKGERMLNGVRLLQKIITTLLDPHEFTQWSFYGAVIAEIIATVLFLYITILTVIASRNAANCGGVGIFGIAWAFGGMNFVLVYCTAGISGTAVEACYKYKIFDSSLDSFTNQEYSTPSNFNTLKREGVKQRKALKWGPCVLH